MALVESPAQLVNVLEWAHHTAVDLSQLTTVVLAPRNEMTRLQLRRTTELATAAGHRVHWHEPRRDAASSVVTAASLAGELRGAQRLIVGDPFSGIIQLVLGVLPVSEVVVVDDGTATLEFARLWTAGSSLVRWHSTSLGLRRRHVAALAARRIAAGSRCRLSVFTVMPVQLQGVEVIRNRFSWVRSRFAAPEVKAEADLVGTSLVETGVVDETHYLAGVRTLTEKHHVDRYFAHRKETDAKLSKIAGLGLKVVRPDLPLELLARRTPVGRTLVSFPSTVVHTLPLVLSDTESRMVVCDIADEWFTGRAPRHSEQFLGRVTTSARDTYGLAATAC
ncbi:MAG TPA: hypothetical protein VEQ66_05025 [Propionibacteriaceae bacterium]|nr:hypothetical protein [Propionibacteriaceae bacterium]